MISVQCGPELPGSRWHQPGLQRQDEFAGIQTQAHFFGVGSWGRFPESTGMEKEAHVSSLHSPASNTPSQEHTMKEEWLGTNLGIIFNDFNCKDSCRGLLEIKCVEPVCFAKACFDKSYFFLCECEVWVWRVFWLRVASLHSHSKFLCSQMCSYLLSSQNHIYRTLTCANEKPDNWMAPPLTGGITLISC